MHVKSHHSIGLGTASISALLQHAGRAGYPALALTDLETLRGQPELHATCRARGLKPITGVELRAGFSPRRAFGAGRGRVVVLAASVEGYAGLCQIVTSRRGTGGPLAAPLDSLGALDGEAFLLSDHPATVRALARELGPRGVRALLVRPGSREAESKLRTAAAESGVALVADLDAALLDPSERALQRLLAAVHLGCRSDALAPEFDEREGRALLGARAAEALFADVPDAVRESAALAEACCLDLLALPGVPADVERERALQSELELRCRPRLRELHGDGRHARRLASELQLIARLGLAEPFLSVAELASAARERGIPLTARGSAVSSLVAHLLGLSPIDPVAQGLDVERFASEARRSPPDIDLDVASRRRDELIDWYVAHRGAERTARIAALHTFQRRSAHRAGLEALGAPRPVIERFLRHFPPDELGDAGRVPRAQLPPPWRAELERVGGLVGKPRHVALHPGGVLLEPGLLRRAIPLERTPGGARVSQYDAEALARMGRMKLDLLGNHCLDEIDQTWAALRERGVSLALGTGARLDPARQGPGDMPLDDAATLGAIDRAETLGCYQIESPALRATLARLPVRRLRDVTHALAIVRPGPASGQAKEIFIGRARGELPVPLSHPALSERLGETFGLLLFEEDIAWLLATLSGVPLARAERLRVTLQERGEDAAWLERVRARLVRRATERGFPESITLAAWSELVRFVSYSFNKAHATSQALLAYQAAFLLEHAPLEFGCALLDHHGGLYPRRVLAAALARRGLALLPPSILDSDLGCAPRPLGAGAGEGIRVGLALIKGLRAASRQRALAWQDAGAPGGIGGLAGHVQPRRREWQALLGSGALDDLLGLGPGDHPWVHEVLLAPLERAEHRVLPELIARTRERLPREPPELVARYRALRRIQNELAYLEMHVSAHPLGVLRAEAERLGCVPSPGLCAFAGRRVAFAGVIAATRRLPLSEHAVAQYITLEDEHGLVEARLSPAVYERCHTLITTPGPFLTSARVVDQQGLIHLELEELLPFHLRPAAEPA